MTDSNTPAWLLAGRPTTAPKVTVTHEHCSTQLECCTACNLVQAPNKRAKQQEAANSPSSTNTPATQARQKRRKHEGVRFGPAPVPEAAPVPQQWQPAKSHSKAIHYEHNERKLAEAQLHGRRYQLDTSSCSLPQHEVFFSTAPWSLPDMMAAKQELNEIKDKLDTKEIK